MATPDIPQVEIAIVEMTNAIRAQHKLNAVKSDPALEAAARSFAQYLARSDTFSHTADGRQPSDRAKAAGYEPCFVAENLSSNFDTRGFETKQLATDAVEGWMNSPGHRKNILAEHATQIGVAVAKAPHAPKFISVQLFGRPRSLAYTFRITNASGQTVGYEFNGQTHEIAARYMSRHTACQPGDITFRSKSASGAVIGRYEARDGNIYVLRRAHDNKVRIEVTRSPQ